MKNARLRPLGAGHSLAPWGAHLLALYTSDFALGMTVIRLRGGADRWGGLLLDYRFGFAGGSCSSSDVQSRSAHRPVCRYPDADHRLVP